MRMRCECCQYTLLEDELKCPQCGTPVMVDEGPTPTQRRCQLFLTGFLVLMFALTALSIVSDLGPSFMTSSSITVVLLLIRSSMLEMTNGKATRSH